MALSDSTIAGREGGLLSVREEAAGLPPLPRSKKEGLNEAILSVAARLKTIEAEMKALTDLEGDDSGEAF